MTVGRSRALRSPALPLDDELFLCGDRDRGSLRTLEHPAAERLLVDREPGQRRAAGGLIHRRDDQRHFARLHANANLLARLDHIARNVHQLAVPFAVAVPHQLARRLAAGREAHPIDDVVETALERGEEVVPRDARHRRHPLERVAELLLVQAVDPLDLLLLAELLGVLRRLTATRLILSMLTRSVGTTLDGAFLGEALGALEEQLGALAAALLAAWSDVTTHVLDSPTLWRTAAIVRNGRHVLDRFHLKS